MSVWTEDMELEARRADYDRGFLHGKSSAQGVTDAVVSALRFYACSCAEGQCAMSDTDDGVPVDDQLCGRTASAALRTLGDRHDD